MKTAYFSLGCFWSPQLEFEKLEGVKKAEVGYCGGDDPNTTYEKVCSGSTNHAETVKIDYDEKLVSYEDLVRFFFKILILVLKNFLFLLLGSLKTFPKFFLAMYERWVFLNSRSGLINLVPFFNIVISCMEDSPSTPLPLESLIKNVST